MTAALAGAVLWLEVLLVEKTDRVGGTTARSTGSVRVPNSRHSPPGEDGFEDGLTYLRSAVGNRLDAARATAFLRARPGITLGPAMTFAFVTARHAHRALRGVAAEEGSA